ncbi:hypothetical protein GCM10011584_33990 [Nocardioides phosphati]|uniref:DNA primase/polymerase bifunctional N-terminal domain-containing protein n=1 Tax=Nocardioides phosphati TaxID=1867775 RepID=A0ABQ2NEX9_9ACTN|nr:hypothetical protein [Nocardioides phosphati]GGO93998.1 hypothetical protein GCM10011584_33990 [Nocardioides phosphati]
MSRSIIRQLDARLFEPRRWFLIDAEQNKLADVPTLERGLALIAAGNAAAVVGRLSPGVTVIDVDAGGIEGDAITENLIGWLIGRGRWHLVRPSGGGQGRNHVYCVPGADAVMLREFVQDLRISYGLPAVKIDMRGPGGSLRPLSSPHRRTGVTPAPYASGEELHAALLRLRRELPKAAPDTRTARERKAVAGRSIVALEPLPRRRSDVEPRWAAWIEARGPVPHIGGLDQSRSAIELAATTALMRAGLRADDAWRTIQSARGGAFAKARTRGRSWWTQQQWNRAVREDTAFHEAHATTPVAAGTTTSPETLAAVETARADLQRLQWLWGPRERHSVLLVAHTLLDRMTREDNLAVPCPLRNLEEDTGLARNTVLSAFAALENTLGHRLATFDHTRAESSSHVFELDSSYIEGSLSLVEPPGFTPTQPPPPGRWASLTPTSHSLWRTLPPAGQPTQPLEVLAQSAGLSHSPTSVPSARQARTLRARLAELAGAGLAEQNADGTWRRLERGNSHHERVASAAHQRIHDRIVRERTEYRSGAWNRWNRGRLQALRANRARQLAWWENLPELERGRRRRACAIAFSELPQSEQAERRHNIAAVRHRAGGRSERELHADWCRRFDHATQADRSAEWKHRFLSLSPAERGERERLLQDHRRRWHLPPTWSTSDSSVSSTPLGAVRAA